MKWHLRKTILFYFHLNKIRCWKRNLCAKQTADDSTCGKDGLRQFKEGIFDIEYAQCPEQQIRIKNGFPIRILSVEKLG